jgi:Tfp pilus assembly protein PilV
VPSGRPRGDRGESLIEVTMSVLILSIAVVALLGGLVTAVIMSDVHRKQAQAGTVVRAYAEAVQLSIATGGYKPCGAPSDYPNLAATTGFTGVVTRVWYWNGATFAPSPCGTDAGVQQLTLQVNSTVDSRVSETLQVVIRKPCRPAPLDTPCA